MSGLQRASAWLSGVWAGLLLAIAAIAAPALFALLEREQAALVARRIFTIEAYVAIAFAVALYLMQRRIARQAFERGTGPALSLNLVLVLGTLFCTIAGYFAVQPMMEAARSGSAPLSFGALHAVSSAFYALKTVLVIALAWRTTAQ
jgi:hypothetical protein